MKIDPPMGTHATVLCTVLRNVMYPSWSIILSRYCSLPFEVRTIDHHKMSAVHCSSLTLLSRPMPAISGSQHVSPLRQVQREVQPDRRVAPARGVHEDGQLNRRQVLWHAHQRGLSGPGGVQVPGKNGPPGHAWHISVAINIMKMKLNKPFALKAWSTVQSGAAGCEKGFVTCFLTVPLACLGCMAAAVQPNCLWTSQKTFYTTCCPRL